MPDERRAPQSRTKTGGKFRPGQSGNPAGRPKAQPGFTARAKELSIPVLENMAKIATNGRGQAAVKAGELVLAYAEGKPTQTVNLNARTDAGAIAGSPDAARQRLEAMIAAEQAKALPPRNDSPSDAERDAESSSGKPASPSENGASGEAARASSAPDLDDDGPDLDPDDVDDDGPDDDVQEGTFYDGVWTPREPQR